MFQELCCRWKSLVVERNNWWMTGRKKLIWKAKTGRLSAFSNSSDVHKFKWATWTLHSSHTDTQRLMKEKHQPSSPHATVSAEWTVKVHTDEFHEMPKKGFGDNSVVSHPGSSVRNHKAWPLHFQDDFSVMLDKADVKSRAVWLHADMQAHTKPYSTD